MKFYTDLYHGEKADFIHFCVKIFNKEFVFFCVEMESKN